MSSWVNELIEEAKRLGIFKRDRKSLEIKIIAGLLYFLGLSLRKTSQFLSIFEEISHESVRTYYHKLKKVLKEPVRKERRLIAIDETKIKINGKWVYVWSAIDVETKECLAIWVSESRGSFEAYVFLRDVLKYCKNEPEFVVDGGTWYLWAFKRLGLKFKHETFGSRNVVESFFSLLKSRTSRFHNRFFNSSFTSVQSWFSSFMLFYNYSRSLS